MITLTSLILLYLAILVVVILHEIGHKPRRLELSPRGINITRWFPFPEAAAMSADYRLGGLAVNFLLLYLIFHFKPELLFLQLIGLVSWIHFVLYTMLGSFNKELPESVIRRNPAILKFWIFDDVPNSMAWLFVPLSIITFWLFKNYYIPILINLFI